MTPATSLIKTPLQRGDSRWCGTRNRFNGFDTVRKTVETVSKASAVQLTPLKRGVNEIGREVWKFFAKPRAKFTLLRVFPLALIALLVPSNHAEAGNLPLKTKNVFLIVTDGFRWQEVFTGAEEALIDKTNGGVRDLEAVRKKFWRATPEARRQALLPFVWSEIALRGQIYGNQLQGSVARVTNDKRFSYPGYNEMLTGHADARIDSNKKIPNPNITVFEWLQGRPGFEKRVAALATWDVFPSIFNCGRSGIPIWPSWSTSPAGIIPSPRLTQLLEDTTPLWPDLILDGFMQQAAIDYIKQKKPRALFLGYGETDEWAHESRYDLYLDSAHNVDRFIKNLWELVQSISQYRGKTTFIITADHGRGSGRTGWKDHGNKTEGAEGIWIAVLGPDTPPLGERMKTEGVGQNQIAATIAALLGEDYRSAFPQAGPPMVEVFRQN